MSTHNEFSGTAHNVVQARTVNMVLPGQPAPVPRQLPPGPGNIVNQRSILRRLDERDSPATALVGTGGVGKTALVIHWSHAAVDQFPDGVLYVDLHGFDGHAQPADPLSVLTGFLHALHVPAARITGGMDERAALLRTMTHGRRMLFILDNAANAEQVRPLLPASPTIATLITCRHELPGLDGVTTLRLDPLPRAESVALLSGRVADERTRDEPALDGLARLCDDLPLLLDIVGCLLTEDPYLGVAELVDELTDERERLDLLELDGRLAPRAVFQRSYRVLPDPVARTFRLLGLLPGSRFSVLAAAALTGVRPAALRRELRTLVRASLLTQTGKDEFQLHDVLRVYAAELAEADGPDAERARHAVLRWYGHAADAAAHRIAPHYRRGAPPGPAPEVPAFDDRDAAMDWCRSEHANLIAVVRMAAGAGESEMARPLAAALGCYFYRDKPWHDWMSVNETVLALGEDGTARNDLATAQREQRRYAEAERNFRRALDTPGHDAHAWAHNGLAQLHREHGAFDQARAEAQAALDAWRELDDRHGQAVAHNALSGILQRLDDHDEALSHSDTSVAAFRELGDEEGEARALAVRAAAQHDPGRAAADYRHALEVQRRIGDRYGQAYTLRSFAGLYTGAQRTELLSLAADIFDDFQDPQAEDIRRELGDHTPG